jgi:Bacterial membrane protein YfhO
LLLAIVVVVLPGVLGGGALYLRDINMVWLPQVESFVHGCADGAWPLWDPYSGFGRPLLADPRAEILYPPTWLNLVLPPPTYYALFTIGHLLLAGGGQWRLARREGLHPTAAATAAGVWMASGPLLSLVSMWHHLAAAAWVPWIVSGFDEVRATASRRSVATAAALFAAQVLAGSPDVTALTLLIVGVRLAPTLARAGTDRRARGGALVSVGAIVLGLALSAAQWMPTLDVVRRSTRWAEAAGAAGGIWSLHPLALFELLVPMRWIDMPLVPRAVLTVLGGRDPWMRSVYLGAASAGLVAAGLAAPRRGRTSLAVLVIAGIALALGDHGPIYPLAASVPGVSALRFPVKALLVAALGWSLLAGAGVDALRAGLRRPRIAALWTSGAVAVFLATAWAIADTVAPGRGPLGAVLNGPVPPWTRAPVAVAAVLTAAITVALAAARRVSAELLAGGLALLGVGDVSWRHRELNPTAPAALFRYRPDVLADVDRSGASRTYVYDYSIDPGVGPRDRPWPYQLARQPPGWTLSAALVLAVHAYLNPPTGARWGVLGSYDLDILGFDSVDVQRIVRALRLAEETSAHLRLLRIGAVGRVLALRTAPWWGDLTPLAEVPGYFRDPIHVFRVPDSLPRAYLVEGVRVADGDAATTLLVDPAFDPTREVVLPAGIAHGFGTDPPGTAAFTHTGWDTLDLVVDARREALLIVVDAYDPGWRATVDGRDAPVERANVAFRAVPVPAGHHVVRLAYRPRAVAAGFACSALAVLSTGLLLRRRSGLSDPARMG